MAWMARFAGQKPWRSNVEREEATVGLIEPKDVAPSALRHHSERRQAPSKTTVALVLSNVMFASLLILTNWASFTVRSLGSQPIGSTAFVSPDALPQSFKTIRFDDLLRYNATSQTVWREMDASLPRYFGPPSPEVDAAWAQLLRYEYPAVTPEEMTLNPSLSFAEKDRYPSTGKFYVALDVFHNLHCLNAVRKQLDKDYYGMHHHAGISKKSAAASSAVDDAQRDHIDHCMNHIRQSLQCRPDLTPAAMNIYTDRDGTQFFLGNADSHSCYDWDQLMTWSEQRRSSPESYVELDG